MHVVDAGYGFLRRFSYPRMMVSEVESREAHPEIEEGFAVVLEPHIEPLSPFGHKELVIEPAFVALT
jgi:hypothetical protein